MKYFQFKAILILIIVFTFSCKSSKEFTNDLNETTSTIEDFDKFYDKFHADSVFQSTRIKFPLEGLRYDGVEETHWTKENFGFLSTRIYDVDTNEYKTSYKKSKDEFIEKVWIEDSGFWCEYKFKLIKNKWYLISAVEQDL